jgi:hypothetical protein
LRAGRKRKRAIAGACERQSRCVNAFSKEPWASVTSPSRQAENMAAQPANVTISLANSEPSTHGTSVWTGRALQAESDDLEVIGLALLYPALERNVCVPGHHGYPRASDLILGKAHRGRSCHQIMDATARPFLHLFIPARRPRRESRLMLLGSA